MQKPTNETSNKTSVVLSDNRNIDLNIKAWQLAMGKNWQLLREVIGSQEVDLNIANPTDNPEFDSTPSLAWWLAVNNQLDLLREMKGSQEINLNATSWVDNGPFRGLSLALCLAMKHQFGLLKELKGGQEINLNAAISVEGHPHEGKSLACWLVVKDQFDLLRELKGSQEIDLNATCHGDQHPLKGLSLALCIVMKTKFELLRELKGNQEINLNAALLANHINKGCSVAMFLVGMNQFGLLRELKGAQEINLNATCLGDNHPLKGITIALDLVMKNQLDLLEELKGSQVVDLNAAIIAPGHSHRGQSLAWWLVIKRRLDLLRELKFSQEVNLNATCLGDDHPSKGLSIALYLTIKNKFNVLKELKGSQIINLNAATSAEAHPEKGQSLAWLLVKGERWKLLNSFLKEGSVVEVFETQDNIALSENGTNIIKQLILKNQWSILASIIKNYHIDKQQFILDHFKKGKNDLTPLHNLLLLGKLECLIGDYYSNKEGFIESGEEEISQLFEQLNGVAASSDFEQQVDILRDKFILAQSERKLLGLIYFLQHPAWGDEKIDQVQNLISELFESLDSITPESPYYPEANNKKAHIILNCLVRKELYEWLSESREATFLQYKPSGWQELTAEMKLRLYMDYYLSFDRNNIQLRYQYLIENYLTIKKSVEHPEQGGITGLPEQVATMTVSEKGKEKVTTEEVRVEVPVEQSQSEDQAIARWKATRLQSLSSFTFSTLTPGEQDVAQVDTDQPSCSQ